MTPARKMNPVSHHKDHHQFGKWLNLVQGERPSTTWAGVHISRSAWGKALSPGAREMQPFFPSLHCGPGLEENTYCCGSYVPCTYSSPQSPRPRLTRTRPSCPHDADPDPHAPKIHTQSQGCGNLSPAKDRGDMGP